MQITTTELLKPLGIAALNPMQQSALEVIGRGRHVLLLSPAGTGKTLAFLIPLTLQLDAERDQLQALVICPTRELAQQNEAVFRSMKTPLRSISLYGGRPTMDEHRRLREIKPQIVFATPGRLLDHVQKGNVETQFATRLFIDEYDKCLELGFQAEMAALLAAFGRVRQYVLTSATTAIDVPAFIDEAGSRLNFLPESKDQRTTTLLVPSPDKDKLDTLARLLSYVKGAPAIVFVAHRESTERIGRYLREQGFIAQIYHGGMEQDDRERALYKFRAGSSNVLVATDLAARGLDIPEVRAVVHYHLPLNADDFTHRSGRATRWDNEGTAYVIKGPAETLPDFIHADGEVCVDDQPIAAQRPVWTSLYIGRGKKDKLSKMDIVGFLCKKGGLKANDIGRIDVVDHHAYVAVSTARLKTVLQRISGEKIKNMKTLIEPMRS